MIDDDAIIDKLVATGVRRWFPIDQTWIVDCQVNREKEPIANLANIMLGLRTAPELRDLFGFDEMSCATMLLRQPPAAAYSEA